FNPNTDPFTSRSHYGLPNPSNAVATNTPPVDSSPCAYFSPSAESRNRRTPSRNHWIAEPATNILPSSAYSTFPSIPLAIVVNSPCSDTTACSPVFINIKQPVPYVFFPIPRSKQA